MPDVKPKACRLLKSAFSTLFFVFSCELPATDFCRNPKIVIGFRGCWLGVIFDKVDDLDANVEHGLNNTPSFAIGGSIWCSSLLSFLSLEWGPFEIDTSFPCTFSSSSSENTITSSLSVFCWFEEARVVRDWTSLYGDRFIWTSGVALILSEAKRD